MNGSQQPPDLNDGTSGGGTSPKVPILIALFALLLFGGYWYWKTNKAAPPVPVPTPPLQTTNVPTADLRLHGSNTIGAVLAPALVNAFLTTLHATNVQTTSLGKDESRIQANIPRQPNPLTIEIFAHGSKTAFADLGTSKCDIGMSSRKVDPNTKEDQAAIKVLGDLSTPASEHVLGLDGVAVIVNRSNPVTRLTKDQLADIFSGKIMDWRDVGRAPGPIHVFARDDNSGTFDTFKSLVLKTQKLTAAATRLEDSKELSDKVSEDNQAIGFIGLPYVLNSKAIAVSEAEKSGRTTTPLFPNRLTVATEDYPLSRRLFLYTPSDPHNAWTREFVSFALSKAGQDVVGANGFVSQTPVSVNPDCTVCPSNYKRLTEGKSRLTTNFHFETGRSTLEDKALIDVGRVVDLLADLKYNGKGIVLLGFADNVGSPAVNLALSKSRADVVAKEFISHGVQPDVVDGMGIIMPVASNDDPKGREKNRRVEIWVNR